MNKYLIVGNGQLAKHLQHYFSLLNLNYKTWYRRCSENLSTLIADADRVCLAISDDSLADFVRATPELTGKTVIHFSGAHHVPGAYTAHPLMTFGPELYPRETYLAVPFITVEGEPAFRELFPELPNPTAAIPYEKKSLYHAFCVVSGNFVTLIWQNVFRDFAARLNISPDLLQPFLRQTVNNAFKNPDSALTGPIARGDVKTIIRNLDALAGTPYQPIYYALLNFFYETQKAAQAKANEAVDEHFRI